MRNGNIYDVVATLQREAKRQQDELHHQELLEQKYQEQEELKRQREYISSLPRCLFCNNNFEPSSTNYFEYCSKKCALTDLENHDSLEEYRAVKLAEILQRKQKEFQEFLRQGVRNRCEDMLREKDLFHYICEEPKVLENYLKAPMYDDNDFRKTVSEFYNLFEPIQINRKELKVLLPKASKILNESKTKISEWRNGIVLSAIFSILSIITIIGSFLAFLVRENADSPILISLLMFPGLLFFGGGGLWLWNRYHAKSRQCQNLECSISRCRKGNLDYSNQENMQHLIRNLKNDINNLSS